MLAKYGHYKHTNINDVANSPGNNNLQFSIFSLFLCPLREKDL